CALHRRWIGAKRCERPCATDCALPLSWTLRALSPIWRPDIGRCGWNGVAKRNRKKQLLRPSRVKMPGRLSENARSRQAADDLIARGNEVEDRGDVEAALEIYRRALTTARAYPRAHLNVGNAIRRLDRLDEAAAAF